MACTTELGVMPRPCCCLRGPHTHAKVFLDSSECFVGGFDIVLLGSMGFSSLFFTYYSCHRIYRNELANAAMGGAIAPATKAKPVKLACRHVGFA